jgi:elongation factor P
MSLNQANESKKVKIIANDIRVGNVLEYNKRLWVVLKTMHTQPGKGGAYMQVEMKDIKDGTKNNVRFRSGETVERVHLDQKTFQYLYDEGESITLMDKDTFEQRLVSKDLLGEQAPFLQEGMDVTLEIYNDEPVLVMLPETVVMEVVECEPVVKGQTVTASYKPATLTNGVRITVPQFISQGDKIVVRVETQEYLERAK